MKQHIPNKNYDISRSRAFVAGTCDSLPGILVPIPTMLFGLLGLKQTGFDVGQMTAVFAFFPLLWAWWAVLVFGTAYSFYRIGHQRRVFWLAVLFGLVYGGAIPCWILLRSMFA